MPLPQQTPSYPHTTETAFTAQQLACYNAPDARTAADPAATQWAYDTSVHTASYPIMPGPRSRSDQVYQNLKALRQHAELRYLTAEKVSLETREIRGTRSHATRAYANLLLRARPIH